MTQKITALQLQKRNRQRVSVYLDGEFAFGLARIVAAWLYVGQELSEEKITELKNEDAREVTYQQALKLLNYQTRSQAELRRGLAERGAPSQLIDETIERLLRAGLLDDARFANAWVENRNEFHPRSRKALAIELRQRGLDDGHISQALEGLDDEELAYQAALKQSRKIHTTEWFDFRKKLSSFLARRGFHYEVINPTVKRVWDEIQSGVNENGN